MIGGPTMRKTCAALAVFVGLGLSPGGALAETCPNGHSDGFWTSRNAMCGGGRCWQCNVEGVGFSEAAMGGGGGSNSYGGAGYSLPSTGNLTQDLAFSVGMAGAQALGEMDGNWISNLLFGGGSRPDPEAARRAAIERERQRVARLEAQRSEVAAWEAEEAERRALVWQARQQRQENLALDRAEALGELEALARLSSGGGFDGAGASGLPALEVREGVGAFGSRVLLPGRASGGDAPVADGAVRLPAGASTPRLLRGAQPLFTQPDAPPRITEAAPAQATIRILPDEGQAAGGVGIGRAAPPPQRVAEAEAGKSWGVREASGEAAGYALSVLADATKGGLVEAAKQIKESRLGDAARWGKSVPVAAVVQVVGDWGVALLDAGIRHQDRRATTLAEAARAAPENHRRIQAIRRRLAEPDLPAVERDLLVDEKQRLTREVIELARLQAHASHLDPETAAFDATFNQRALLEATGETVMAVWDPLKKGGDALGSRAHEYLAKHQAGLLDSTAWKTGAAIVQRGSQAFDAGVERLGGGARWMSDAASRAAARKGLETAISKPIKDGVGVSGLEKKVGRQPARAVEALQGLEFRRGGAR